MAAAACTPRPRDSLKHMRVRNERDKHHHKKSPSEMSLRRQASRPRKQGSSLSKGTNVSLEEVVAARHVSPPHPLYLYLQLVPGQR